MKNIGIILICFFVFLSCKKEKYETGKYEIVFTIKDENDKSVEVGTYLIQIVSETKNTIEIKEGWIEISSQSIELKKKSHKISGDLSLSGWNRLKIVGKLDLFNSEKIKGTFEGEKIQGGSPGGQSPLNINLQGDFVMTKQ